MWLVEINRATVKPDMIKKVTGLRDSHTRVIASKSVARTSISFKDLPLLYIMIGGIFEYFAKQ